MITASNYPKLSFAEKTVLITGGTRGIGLNLALTFASLGAFCVMTYRWGEHDEADLKQQFATLNAPEPLFIQADVANNEDTLQLMQCLKEKVSTVDILISNVSASLVIRSFDDYSFHALKKSLSYSAWPLVSYFKHLKKTFGHYPKYVMAISSTGPDSYTYGYDFVAASKAVLETFCRYLSYRLKKEDVVINAVRSRAIKTQSFGQTFGNDFDKFANELVPSNYWIESQELSNTIIALCSGYCDAIKGQVITVDRGTSFFDNYMDIYTRHEAALGDK